MSSQESRFRKWQHLAPASTRLLSTMVNSRLVSVLEAQGFARVDYSLRQPEWTVSGSHIELERWTDDIVDTVTFNFDKYRTPRFQIHLSRRSSQPPHEWVRAANLVRRPTQYLHFWGKPWWLPSAMWSEGASRRVIGQLESMLPGALAFLAGGERGRHISRQDR